MNKTYTLEEQKANRKLWVEALRSGEYQQATQSLTQRGGGYCCLGVACRVMGVPDEVIRHHDNLHQLDSVRAHFGIIGADGDYEDGSLANDNDKRGKSFAEIADIIESEPAGLFVESEA